MSKGETQQQREQRARRGGGASARDVDLSPERVLRRSLVPAEAEEWSRRPDKDRQVYLEQINKLFFAILDDLFDQANRCVATVGKAERSHALWRKWVILATGGLAILNLLAAITWNATGWLGSLVGKLSVLAAIYAGGLAVVTNLESFHNFQGRSQAHRESRELILDAFREFEMLWETHVRPFGDSSEACLNATELYARLVARDAQLRSRVKELRETKRSGGEGLGRV